MKKIALVAAFLYPALAWGQAQKLYIQANPQPGNLASQGAGIVQQNSDGTAFIGATAGGGVQFTDGTNTVPNATQLTFNGGSCTVSGSTPNATVLCTGGGGSTAFSALTSGTNTSFTGIVGSGASLTASGSGVIAFTTGPLSGITGFGAGCATWLATPSSANLRGCLTDESGTGSAVFATSPTITSPTLVTPALGTPASGVATNLTGLPLTTGVTGTLPVTNGGIGVATLTGLAKGNGTSAFSVATAGTDYAAATTGSANTPLFNNGSGGFTNGTRSGNTTEVGTVSGALVSGNCVQSDVNHNLVDSGSTNCGGGGGSGGPGTWSGGGNTATGVSSTAAFGNGFVVTPNGASGGTVNINTTVADVSKTTNYTVAAGDMAGALTLGGSTAALTLPAASSTIFAPGMTLSINVQASGAWTLTNSTGLSYSGPTTFPPGSQGTFIANANGTSLDFFGSLGVAATSNNWVDSITAAGPHLSQPNISNLSGFGSNVATAAGQGLSTVGGFPKIVTANGQQALGTSSISGNTCATVITVSASGVATTDVIDIGYSSDPHGVTGYAPGGGLYIQAYPTANNINILVCNAGSSPVTPGALTINYAVRR